MAKIKKFIVHPTDDRLAGFPKEVQDLVKKGRGQGFITQEELLKAVPHAEDDVILLDEIYSLFLDCGVDPRVINDVVTKNGCAFRTAFFLLCRVTIPPGKNVLSFDKSVFII